ncbi:MAG: hypothetical protein J4F48_06745, partial [Nitrospinae bacterium]|nr:hypothetical protein [Nitrospinota bacterium]
TGLPALASPPLFNAAPYVDKFLSSDLIIAAYVHTIPLKKIVIPFPISQRIEKMVFFVNKQSRGKFKNIFLPWFDICAGSRDGIEALTFSKSTF